MLAFRCRALGAISPISVGTFVEHLPAIIPSTFNPYRNNNGSRNRRRTLSASAAHKATQLETLSPRQREQINLYVDALLQWNQKMNLTAVTVASEVMERHVEDSLAIIPPIRSSYVSHCGASSDELSLVDVGSGAGLPGLILAIACPGWKITLLESINKRCVFLEHAVGLTGLSNVQVVRDRAENFGQNLAFREAFDVAVARAVAELRVLAEYCLPLVRVGGIFVAAKGPNPLEEVKRAEKAVQLLGASILQTCHVDSHGPHGQRTAIVCSKHGHTPKRYPREPGTPVKSPLSAI